MYVDYTEREREQVSHTDCQFTDVCISMYACTFKTLFISPLWIRAAVLNSSLVIHDNCSLSASFSHTHTHLQTVTKQQYLLEQGPFHIVRQGQALFRQRTLSWARLSLAVTRSTDRRRDRWRWRNHWIHCHSPRWETSSMHHQTRLIQLLP